MFIGELGEVGLRNRLCLSMGNKIGVFIVFVNFFEQFDEYFAVANISKNLKNL
jgi:hypothetical protein